VKRVRAIVGSTLWMDASPRARRWLLFVLPLIASPLFVWDALRSGDPVAIGRNVLALYLPFAAIPVALQAAYRHLLPRLAGAAASARTRVTAEVVLTAVTPALVAVALKPAFELVAGGPAEWAPWLIAAQVVTWISAIPKLVLRQLREEMERAVLAERHAKAQAELAALRARTDPHFLFNSLNAIAALVHADPELAERTIERVAELLRYTLATGKERLVPLARELAITRDYFEIERARFGDRVTFAVDVADGAAERLVPPLAVQVLVENAILHAAQRSAAPVAIAVRAAVAGGVLAIEVDDDGPGPGASTHRGAGTGLRDLGARINLLYGPGARVELRPRPGGGVRARLALPERAAP
jgi:two-component system, LytTR family, sensor histidine kinase AlgZ